MKLRELIEWYLTHNGDVIANEIVDVVKDWIKTHHRGYIATWQIAEQLSNLKDLIRGGVDRQVGTNIGAELRGQQGHEGYVADTPSGKIKLVNRPHFMRKDITI